MKKANYRISTIPCLFVFKYVLVICIFLFPVEFMFYLTRYGLYTVVLKSRIYLRLLSIVTSRAWD